MFVYFITGLIPGSAIEYVKIGLAKNPAKRLEALQTGFPGTLTLKCVMWCGNSPLLAANVERRFHRCFDRHRLTGEWFTRVPEMDPFISGESSVPIQHQRWQESLEELETAS